MNDRLAVTRRVLRAMRHETVRQHMDDFNDDGVPQIVICLPEDTIAYAQDRVGAVGGTATVVTPHGAGLITLAWNINEVSAGASAAPDGPMHPDSTIGMLLDWLTTSQTTECTFRVTTETGAAEIVEGEQITVPA